MIGLRAINQLVLDCLVALVVAVKQKFHFQTFDQLGHSLQALDQNNPRVSLLCRNLSHHLDLWLFLYQRVKCFPLQQEWWAVDDDKVFQQHLLLHYSTLSLWFGTNWLGVSYLKVKLVSHHLSYAHILLF